MSNETKLLPVTENIRLASQILRELSRNPTPNVMALRDLASKLDWISSQVEVLEKRDNPDVLSALRRLLRADEQPPDETQAVEAVAAMAYARGVIFKATGGAMTLCNLCGCPVPPSRYGHTSTLCEDCLDGLREDHADAIAEYRRERPDDDMDAPDDEGTQGKRPDQLCYSGGILIVGVVLLALLLSGLSLGAWVAYWTTPMP